MSVRLVDLSSTLGPELPELVPLRISRTNHKRGILGLALGSAILAYFEERSWRATLTAVVRAIRLARARDGFPDGLGLATEQVNLTTHSGTHMDAPYHYGPLSGGSRAVPIDEVDLTWCYGRGVVLDLRSAPARSAIDAAQIQKALEAARHDLAPGDIVLVRTGAAERLRGRDYLTDFAGLTADAVHWLVERGVRVIGIDAFGLDKPFQTMLADWATTGNQGALWPAHMAGRARPYCQIERLTNLESLPSTGFKVACFPIKIRGASAGWVRAVAFVEEGNDA